jgi:deoxyribodipyrimidine photo-lyase
MQTETLAERSRVLKEGAQIVGPVGYWMSRDQRVRDSWALLYAQRLAWERQQPLIVVFCLVPDFLEAQPAHYRFMVQGLQEVEAGLLGLHIGFYLLRGQPQELIPAFIQQYGISLLVTDFDPLRPKRRWLETVAERIDIPVHQVDAHNVAPCWVVSGKQEFAARTIRPKIQRLLPVFLSAMPAPAIHPFQLPTRRPPVNWDEVRGDKLCLSAQNTHIVPGEAAAWKSLQQFLNERLASYPAARNDPNAGGQSGLSPYLHFGQISAQRVAWEVQRSDVPAEAKAAFLEELIIRRELSDNFCWYNHNYDQVAGFPAWAISSLDKHRSDPRPYLYTLGEFEAGETHDPLWNAAQMEMVKTGKMHGYMRMYWAKKILEWSTSPEEALSFAIKLNNRYELDGRDSNGYAGIAWSIGGVHDRPWFERPVFGQIRYMNYAGCSRKFDVPSYIERIGHL